MFRGTHHRYSPMRNVIRRPSGARVPVIGQAVDIGEDVPFHLEGPTERRELGKYGMTGLAGHSGLPCKAGRRICCRRAKIRAVEGPKMSAAAPANRIICIRHTHTCANPHGSPPLLPRTSPRIPALRVSKDEARDAADLLASRCRRSPGRGVLVALDDRRRFRWRLELLAHR
jgi:hypothetical protein